ncbi:hypothetical protein MAPG_01914 [Magnaporthiopsis poae ATCC 64411]|uniref:Uncharacterized protein n=1 Tax=Magnaporthiopsis poae (strain ATCC 64411 / 73-15) TaxID=644358 RepID=A0A0C4DPY3_MAGP6|nr:hypothetical protein MAPG_01914 [Magnaporthiopsis poae ATCC 64411]
MLNTNIKFTGLKYVFITEKVTFFYIFIGKAPFSGPQITFLGAIGV